MTEELNPEDSEMPSSPKNRVHEQEDEAGDLVLPGFGEKETK